MKTPSSVQQIIILDCRLSWILIKERGPKFIEKLDQEKSSEKMGHNSSSIIFLSGCRQRQLCPRQLKLIVPKAAQIVPKAAQIVPKAA